MTERDFKVDWSDPKNVQISERFWTRMRKNPALTDENKNEITAEVCAQMPSHGYAMTIDMDGSCRMVPLQEV